jgi:hypothetical protein
MNTADMIISQAVLQYVDQLDDAMGWMHQWLKRGGVMSHQVDYRSDDLVRPWNRHWTMSRLAWRLVEGKQPAPLTCRPHSRYVRAHRDHGFNLTAEQTTNDATSVTRLHLARRYAQLTDHDLVTSGSLLQSVKADE